MPNWSSKKFSKNPFNTGGELALKVQYPTNYDASTLAATIPFTSASPERSFIKLKLLETASKSPGLMHGSLI